jgi:hypothetical protein
MNKTKQENSDIEFPSNRTDIPYKRGKYYLAVFKSLDGSLNISNTLYLNKEHAKSELGDMFVGLVQNPIFEKWD